MNKAKLSPAVKKQMKKQPPKPHEMRLGDAKPKAKKC